MRCFALVEAAGAMLTLVQRWELELTALLVLVAVVHVLLPRQSEMGPVMS